MFWFPTLKTCQNPLTLKGVGKRLFIELQQLQDLDGKNQHNNIELANRFLQRLKWYDSLVNADKKQQVE